jgi:hypothetical protein
MAGYLLYQIQSNCVFFERRLFVRSIHEELFISAAGGISAAARLYPD